MDNKKVVCIGGGIGTVNLIKGLKKYFKDITVVVSMADDGGSSGRLRRLYDIFPPGDIVSGMSALIDKRDSVFPKLLTYRFPGNRYGKDDRLTGHKLGNLIIVALRDITGSFEEAVEVFQKTFHVSGHFFPATEKHVSISAKTAENKIIHGEINIDLGRYAGKRILERVYLHPANAKANKNALAALKSADLIIAGPGDLYTTILPALLVPEISSEVKKSKASKFFVVNVANKPFETKGYSVPDYITSIKKHLGSFPFDHVFVNNNYSVKIPRKFRYQYVHPNGSYDLGKFKVKTVTRDLVDEEFPLYHSFSKLAKAIVENI